MFRKRLSVAALLFVGVTSGSLLFGPGCTGCRRVAQEDEQTGDSPVEEEPGESRFDVLLLETQFHPGRELDSDKGRISGELVREILRQGVLIAARDELRLPTRDATLREPFVDQDGNKLQPLEATTVARLNEPLQIRLTRRDGREQHEIWKAEYEQKHGGYRVYTDLIPLVEADSRTVLVDALRRAGYGVESGTEGEPTPLASDEGPESGEADVAAEIPEEIRQQLLVMHVAPQFAAVRWAHGVNAEHGQTTESLSALVRGYAHLAMLTEGYWNSMSRAYKARALLYAERMVAAYPDSSQAAWHRAYALAIVGIHGAALAELKGIAEKFGEDEPPADRVPGCMTLIEPCCRYDGQGLLDAAAEDASLLPLAHFLNLRVALAIADDRLLISACQEALKHNPDTYEIYSVLATTGELAIIRMAAQTAPAAMSAHLPIHFKALKDLPEPAQLPMPAEGPRWLSRLFDGGQDDAPVGPSPHQAAGALVDAGRVGADSAEPSWGVLGRMIQEENLLLSVQILNAMANAVRYSLEDSVAELMPLVDGHPYASYIESYRIHRDEKPNEFAEIVSDLRFVEPQYHMVPALRRFCYIKTNESRTLGVDAVNACSHDFTAYSLLFSRWYGNWEAKEAKDKDMFAREFKEVSPHCPEILQTEIALTSEPTQKQLLEWEEAAAGFPDTLAVLGRRHWWLRQCDDAARCMEKSVSASPSNGVFSELAEVYETLGKSELYVPTLERSLEFETYGLGHASIHSKIAHWLMDGGKWEEAEPHALKAAETYSAWGMECAARCYEGLEDWENSELWIRRESESYGRRSRLDWYLWCRRTGRGDLEAARQQAREYLDPASTQGTYRTLGDCSTFYLLEGDRRRAFDRLRPYVREGPDVMIIARLLLMAVEFKDRDLQDKACQEIEKWFTPKEDYFGNATPEFARLVVATLRSKDPQKPDLEAMSKIMKLDDTLWGRRHSRNYRTEYGYIFGRILELDGQLEEAKTYYRQVADMKCIDKDCCTLAAHDLARLSKD
ncbi:MAG: hypothetical protein GXX96_14800 [Planctomycetaceae bacterium]|nr:hypothetical protein [Planctomycetaceae bacterium]